MPRKRTLTIFISLAAVALLAVGAWALFGNSGARAADMVVYKSPWCGCCDGWVDHLRRSGFSVQVVKHEDMDPIKRKYGVPEGLQSCHTARIQGYSIEGHVPAADITRLLGERPAGFGLAVPGMPNGSPGMDQEGPADRYAVILWSEAGQRAYATY